MVLLLISAFLYFFGIIFLFARSLLLLSNVEGHIYSSSSSADCTSSLASPDWSNFSSKKVGFLPRRENKRVSYILRRAYFNNNQSRIFRCSCSNIWYSSDLPDFFTRFVRLCLQSACGRQVLK